MSIKFAGQSDAKPVTVTRNQKQPSKLDVTGYVTKAEFDALLARVEALEAKHWPQPAPEPSTASRDRAEYMREYRKKNRGRK